MSIDAPVNPATDDPEDPTRRPPPPLIPPRVEDQPGQDPGDLDDGKPVSEE